MHTLKAKRTNVQEQTIVTWQLKKHVLNCLLHIGEIILLVSLFLARLFSIFHMN